MAYELVWGEELFDRSFAGQVTPVVATLDSCMQCGSCSASCPTASLMADPPQRLMRMVRLGLREEAIASSAFWLCTSCNACTANCPRGIALLDTMIGLKTYAISRGIDVPEDMELLRRTLKERRYVFSLKAAGRLTVNSCLLKKALGILSKELDVPLVPTLIEGTFEVLPRGSIWPRLRKIKVTFGKPIYPKKIDFTERPSDMDDYEWIGSKLRKSISEMKGVRRF